MTAPFIALPRMRSEWFNPEGDKSISGCWSLSMEDRGGSRHRKDSVNPSSWLNVLLVHFSGLSLSRSVYDADSEIDVIRISRQ